MGRRRGCVAWAGGGGGGQGEEGRPGGGLLWGKNIVNYTSYLSLTTKVVAPSPSLSGSCQFLSVNFFLLWPFLSSGGSGLQTKIFVLLSLFTIKIFFFGKIKKKRFEFLMILEDQHLDDATRRHTLSRQVIKMTFLANISSKGGGLPKSKKCSECMISKDFFIQNSVGYLLKFEMFLHNQIFLFYFRFTDGWISIYFFPPFLRGGGGSVCLCVD